MEILWKFRGGIMESSWNFDGENPRLECGETVKHLWRIANVEHLCGINTLENYRLENTKDAIQWSSTRNQTEGLKMLRKIADWATSESGKEVLTGVFWGIVGIIAVRLFCFLVCVVTGYPIS